MGSRGPAEYSRNRHPDDRSSGRADDSARFTRPLHRSNRSARSPRAAQRIDRAQRASSASTHRP